MLYIYIYIYIFNVVTWMSPLRWYVFGLAFNVSQIIVNMEVNR